MNVTSSVVQTGKTYVLQQPENQYGKHLQVLRYGQLRTGTCTSSRHAALVRREYVHHALHDRISTVFQLVRQRPLHCLVCQQRRDSYLISGGKYFREAAGRRKCECDDTNATLAIAGCVQNGRLQNDERGGNGVFNLDLDDIRLICRHSWHCEEVCRSDKEVSMERRHP